MKRLPEFILSLAGAIWGIFVGVTEIWLLIVEKIFTNEDIISACLFSNFMGIVMAGIAIICACLIEKKTKLISKLLIICGILLFLTNFSQTIPATLLIVGGCVGLKRKVD